MINVDENSIKTESKNTQNWAEKLKSNQNQIVVVSAKIESEIILTFEGEDIQIENGTRLSGTAYQISIYIDLIDC